MDAPASFHVRRRGASAGSDRAASGPVPAATTTTTTSAGAAAAGGADGAGQEPGRRKRKRKRKRKPRLHVVKGDNEAYRRAYGTLGGWSGLRLVMYSVLDDVAAEEASVRALRIAQLLTSVPPPAQFPTDLAHLCADDCFLLSRGEMRKGASIGLSMLLAKDIREALRPVARRDWKAVRAMGRHGTHDAFFDGIHCDRFDETWRQNIATLVLSVMDSHDQRYAGVLVYSIPSARMYHVPSFLRTVRESQPKPLNEERAAFLDNEWSRDARPVCLW